MGFIPTVVAECESCLLLRVWVSFLLLAPRDFSFHLFTFIYLSWFKVSQDLICWSVNSLKLLYPLSVKLLFPYYSTVQLLSRVRLFGPRGLQYPWRPCPSPTPGVYSNSCPLSQWHHPTISSSVLIPFSSHPQSFLASRSFQKSQFSASGGQSIGVSASASVLPVNIQD